MRVMVRKTGDDYSVYVPKKDVESAVVAMEMPTLWGGWVELGNGWRLGMPDMAPDTRLPITVQARRISAG